MFGSAGPAIETRRLDQLETFMDDGTLDRLDRVGIRRGDRCLEVGAGRGSIALAMLARCGAEGEVVATDIDARWIEAITAPGFRAVRHDIATDPVDDLGLFDVVHARFLLHHLGLDRGSAALARIAGLLAPGGRILVEEPMGTGCADPRHPVAAEYAELAHGWFATLNEMIGFDIDFGLMLPRLLVEAGLDGVGNDIRGFLSTPGDSFNTWLNTSIASAQAVLDRAYDDNGERFTKIVNAPGMWSSAWLVIAGWATRPAS